MNKAQLFAALALAASATMAHAFQPPVQMPMLPSPGHDVQWGEPARPYPPQWGEAARPYPPQRPDWDSLQDWRSRDSRWYNGRIVHLRQRYAGSYLFVVQLRNGEHARFVRTYRSGFEVGDKVKVRQYKGRTLIERR
ncbi:hypothetical protein [Crenobacter intestini]|uniref:Uncharacterized protein n=1 Tax=Crenobacter intestini TaxID=2563443 RepID=A0A4T0URL7_9NEIS|nr:hypothetical protein [Crenobacter intestini]TIC81367.1 hypothetical protein E5K04_10630 [Crenobacter intestini]